MKHNRRYLICLVILLISVCAAMTACTMDSSKVLNTPANIRKSGNTIAWDAVANADSYLVQLNDKTYAASNNTYNISSFAAGSYSVSVKAICNNNTYSDSAWSSALTVTLTGGAIQTYSLTVLALGGGTVDLTGGEYEENEQIAVTATANEGYSFAYWIGNDLIVGSENPYTFEMPGHDYELTAVFEQDIQTYNLTVIALNGGTVDLTGGEYEENEQVTVTATANEGYVLAYWIGSDYIVNTENPYTFEMPGYDYELTAVFAVKTYRLTVTASGDETIDPLVEYYEENEQVTVTATANEGYVFICWSDDGGAVSWAKTYSFNMPAYDYELAAVFEAEVVDGYQRGDGSENNPYMIYTKNQFEFFRNHVNAGNDYLGIYFALGADIDLEGSEWTPIGTSESLTFKGVFDGNEHIVSNFQITSSLYAYTGLFGYNYGNIENLGVEDFSINVSFSDNVFAGGLIGYNNGGAISYCYATGDVTVSAFPAYPNAGGLIGYNNGGAISYCYATGDATATGYYSVYAGGLIAYNKGIVDIAYCYATGDCYAESTMYYVFSGGLIAFDISDGEITNCHATGNVTAESPYANVYVGGLIGDNTKAVISYCYATGNASGNTTAQLDSYVGGLTGRNGGEAISYCYATGNATAESNLGMAYAGGLIGSNISGAITLSCCYATGVVTAFSPGNAYAGGLLGIGFPNNLISNCYATGSAAATSSADSAYAGGLIGDIAYSTVSNCYAKGDAIAESTASANGIHTYAGGLIGRIYISDPLKNCYATGNATSSTTSSNGFAYAGGLVAIKYSNGIITNCFATGNVSSSDNRSEIAAGALAAYVESNVVVNCYSYSGQIVLIDGTAVEGNTFFGCTVVDASEFTLISFYSDRLGWSEDAWDFSVALSFDNGPVLKGFND